MNRQSIFMLQGIVLFLTGGLLWNCISKYITSLWLSVPFFAITWFAIGWCEIALIGLLNPDIRLASKLGIKVENLNAYREAFNQLMEAEMRGEETGWIGDTLPDKDEWLRYLNYEIKKGLTEESEDPLKISEHERKQL